MEVSRTCRCLLSVAAHRKILPEAEQGGLGSPSVQKFSKITSSSWCHVGARELGWDGWVTEYGRWLLGLTPGKTYSHPLLLHFRHNWVYFAQCMCPLIIHATNFDSIDHGLAPWPISSSYQKSHILFCKAHDIVTETFTTLEWSIPWQGKIRENKLPKSVKSNPGLLFSFDFFCSNVNVESKWYRMLLSAKPRSFTARPISFEAKSKCTFIDHNKS